jgi:hypothetical protein
MQSIRLTQEEAQRRLVRPQDRVSCNLAFIDCKLPGSHLKQNYSFIGPGVTQSSEQVINIPEKHGVNIGAAVMPNAVSPLSNANGLLMRCWIIFCPATVPSWPQ